MPVASFTITKLRWLADAEPENAARVAAVALPHDWLTWRLRGFGPENPVLTELTTDRSDASGTCYFDPTTNEYQYDLLDRALRRPASTPGSSPNSGVGGQIVLPRVLGPRDSAGVVAPTPELAAQTPENGEQRGRIVVGVGAGDNAGAALGLGATGGDVVVSIGTSGTVFAVTDTPARDETGAVAGFADAAGGYLPLVATLNAARVLDAMARVLDTGHDELGRLALEAEAGCWRCGSASVFRGRDEPRTFRTQPRH